MADQPKARHDGRDAGGRLGRRDPGTAPVKIKLPADLADAARASGNHRLIAAAGAPATHAASSSAAEWQQQQLAKLLQRRRAPPQPPPPQQHQQQRQLLPQDPAQPAAHRYDLADCGSFPCRMHLHSALRQDLLAAADPAAADQGAEPLVQHAGVQDQVVVADPLGWVPEPPAAGGRSGGGAPAASAASTSIRPRSAQLRSRTVTSLPLELFDGPEAEAVDIAGQLQDAAAAGRPGLPALSRFYSPDGAFSWQPCTVLQYDRPGAQLLIQWASNGRTKWVKRLNCILLAEDRAAFRFRLLQAQRMRDEMEREARFNHYVASLQFYNHSRLDDGFRQRVVCMAGARLAELLPHVTTEFLDATRQHYRFAVNAAIVQHEFHTPAGSIHLAAAGIQPVQHQHMVPQQGCVALQQLPPGSAVTRRTSQHPGAAEASAEQLPLQPFAAVLQQLQQASLHAQPRLLAALSAYQGLAAGVAHMQLVDVQMGELQRPMQLGAFLALQRLHLENMVEVLQTAWAIPASHISDALVRPQGLPAAADEEQDAEGDPNAPARHSTLSLPGPGVHPQQALCCVQVMTLLMQQHLRALLEGGLAAYLDMWQAYAVEPGSLEACAGYPASHIPAGVQLRATPGANAPWRCSTSKQASLTAWGSDVFCPSPPPMFQLQLLVREGRLQFVPSLEEVQGAVLGMVEAVLQAGGVFEDLAAKAKNPCADAVLPGLAANDAAVQRTRAAIASILQAGLAGPLALQECLADLQHQLDAAGDAQQSTLVDAWAAGGHSIQETAAEIQRLKHVADAVDAMAEDTVWFRLVSVNTRQAKAALMSKALATRHALQAWLQAQWHAGNVQQVAAFEAMIAAVNEEPASTEDMDALVKYAARVQEDLPVFLQQLEASAATLAVLCDSQLSLPDESADVYWQLQRLPLAVQEELAAAAERVVGYRDGYRQQLQHDQQQLLANVQELQAAVVEFTQLGGLPAAEERLIAVQDLEARLAELQRQADLYTAREDIFQLPHSQYPLLAEVQRALEPVAALWRLAAACIRQLPDWTDGPFTDIDAEAVAADVDKWWRGSGKLLRQLSGAPLEAAEAARQQLQAFQAHLPLIAALRNPVLRERHWERVSAAVGATVKADAGFSLSRALQLGLPEHLAAIEEVSMVASKEGSLEAALDKMQAQWAGLCFDTTPWRATGCSILRGVDDIQQLLDDQVVKTMAMRSSPYIGPFSERVRTWEAKLNSTQDILDAWLRCQQGWLYLEPIFGSEDIQQQMPNEGRKFKAVDATWRRLMERLSKQAEVLLVTADEELLKHLAEANKLLEQVQKGLADYLETKRLAFPRFYFLSSDELLEILSETTDPTRVQPFLKKIFEGIAGLEFQPDGSVTAMLSEEGERVPFVRPFNPKAAGGAVERWLIEAESAMRDTVKGVLRSSLEDHPRTPRDTWLGRWPGQVVLAVDCIMWTADTAAAIRQGTLPRHAQRLTSELLQVVNKVRGKLSSLERKVLSALIVIDVHARDVASELAAKGVGSEADFDFLSQLRYNWEDGGAVVRMVNAAITYGYEYLGVSSRLVITPLTDRCYRTLMGALHLNLGGAPEGPAGTGKTETTKDLAKAVAMQCVVFNCSDGLDYLSMGKFFKGLASSGAWACFDEFNRIDLEVLSVIAAQIQTMQQVKAAGLKVFEFEGTRLSLRPTFSVFITMNPGYAGRSELPDNLKALFRSVAMMVPDYSLISEISLYSSGYLKARDLARKLVATYRLCSEQLSSQSFYDYGMRAVVSVLRAAAANKQKAPDGDEELLMVRSIRDVNEPKFLAPDVPLFNGILSDLFPGLELPPPDYSHLNAALEAAAGRAQLVPTPAFMSKAQQLYEMILVRHGLMLVGHSYGAKTSVYRCLAAALADIEAKGLMGEHKAHVRVINPKSITLGQLYGQFDPVSHEWKDGVLAKAFREAAQDTRPDRQWLLFDGPVDAIWIENLNTVLDDNKKLCLNSGEIIQMSSSMNLIFEVQDLAVASPATVSRTGMLYLEPSQTGWRPLAQAWLAHRLPASVTAQQRQRLQQLFEWLVDPCVAFLRKHCKELVPTADINLVASLMNLLQSLLEEGQAAAAPQGTEADAPNGAAQPGVCTDALFVFSLVWSLGAACDRPSAAAFDAFVRQLAAGRVAAGPDRSDVDLGPGLTIEYPEAGLLQTPLPEAGLLQDYSFDQGGGQWRPWIDASAPHSIPVSLVFNEIIVPTMDTVRLSHLTRLLATHGKHVLVVGPTGTGKTVCIKGCLDDLASTGAYMVVPTAFSAQTSANQVQDIIDAKLDKRRRGVFGPPIGSRALVFVDDLNMPALEVYGAQPPIELLRQLLDHGGWYDRSDNTMRQIADTQLVASMGLPGGGRNHITPRLLRHFNVVAVNEFDDASYTRIYTAIGDWWAQRAQLEPGLAAALPGVVAATMEVYATIRTSLLPTPAKSHYLYNMRDLSKVFQGMQSLGTPLQDSRSLVRLWAHEAMRVFHDRLVDDADRGWFCGLLARMPPKHFGVAFSEAFPLSAAEEAEAVASVAAAAGGDATAAGSAAGAAAQQAVAAAALRNVVFVAFVQPGVPEAARYQEAGDTGALLKRVEDALVEHNEQVKSHLDLVVFKYAAEHLARISRIIKQPYGNALLVGVGGSGRQSLTRLAAFMADYKLFSIEITKSYGLPEWREDLKKVLLQAGCAGAPTVFLFSDSQLKHESFLEDINNILNTGEVPNLFAKDELVGIAEAVTARAKRAGKPLTPAGLWAFFLDCVRINLHLVLSMSHVGGALRERFRKFPSLVSCTTIDWFSVWPADALKSVARKFLPDLGAAPSSGDGSHGSPSPLRAAVEDTCMLFHTSIRTMAEDYRREAGHHTYVTPTSYLELIRTYTQLLGTQQAAVHQLKTRYEVGLQKLLGAEGEVNVMQQELIALQPKLIETGKEVEDTLRVVDAQTKEAAAKKQVVEGEEAVAADKAAAAKAIKDECEGELAVALPLLESALAALNTLTKADITEVRSMKNPPAPVKVTMEAVCQLLSVKPKKVNDPANPTRKLDDYWGPSQALLGDTTFMTQLQTYDKDNISPACITAVRPYLERPELAPETVKKASKAAYGLCCWVRAMEAYDRVAKVVAPKKAALQQAEGEYATLMEGLAAKKAELAAVVAALDALNAKLAAMQARKQQLEEEVDLCQKKLERATKLIGGLGSEKVRWAEVAAKLAGDHTNLVGDVLLSAGFVAYLGPYTASYRERAIALWVKQCRSAGIPCSSSFKLSSVIGEPVAIRGWLLDGLPNDSLSIDNALIVSKARRWPLMVDPQGQANKWVKTMERAHQLEVVKLTGGSAGDAMRQLENAVQFGFPVLIENVAEELDPLLEPLLSKATFKQGGVSCIRLGDATLEYNASFRLYLTTKLRRPHYLPEVAVKVTLLNFGITREGLEDQLLSVVVAAERPELQEEKARLVLAGAENARQLKEIEDKIIAVLSHSEGNILENETAINVISSSKALSVDIHTKQQVAERTEKKIDEARAGYKPVAQVASVLFFVISELAAVEPMYQWSLAWFTSLFEASLLKADRARDLARRIDALVQHFQYSLYLQVCRGLFEKDKLLFAFLMTVHLKAHVQRSLHWPSLHFLLTGGLSSAEPPANPAGWLGDKQWGELVRLSGSQPGFEGLQEAFVGDPTTFKAVFDATDPAAAPLPAPWASRLSAFQKLLLLRVLRPDKLKSAMHAFVKASLGQKFVESQPLDLEACYADSSATTPLIFVLSPGSDPMSTLLRFAERLKVPVASISLGQGQGPKAAKLIEGARASGGWVVLQNCHLAVSWMPVLEQLVEGFSPDSVHPGFRLWLTSCPSTTFPAYVLQSAIKMTSDPPKGLRQNLLGSFMSDPVNDPAFFGGATRPGEFKALLFGLCFFHAFVQERLKFGPLGWNVPYHFSQPDFGISARQLLMFMNAAPPHTTPMQALLYLTGECNYGGRVTDAHDRRTLTSILSIFYNEAIFKPGYAFCDAPGCGVYTAPPEGSLEETITFIRALPHAAPPEVFGLHANADITSNQQETNQLLDSLLATQGNGTAGSSSGSNSGSNSSREALLLQVAADLHSKLRAPFDIEAAQYKYPVDYYESMNTVLCQELVRFNRLITTITGSLEQLHKALKGQVLMSDDLERVAQSMYDGRVPASWMAASYPNMKPLAAYMADLEARLDMLQGWLERGPPPVFWLPGFFFTHAFLTGVKQNYARRCRIPIDMITFDFSCLPPGPAPTQPPPNGGAYVSGMFVEGARWDEHAGQLAESHPKVLFSPAPLMLLQPCEVGKQRAFPAYECPLYRTPERRGVLATTGHSTNFVMELLVPSDRPQGHWIRRGVAFLLALAD